VIRDKYQILDKVGEGAMGAVYKALHIHFQEVRALKVISDELAGDDTFVKRFMLEGVLTRKLQHPNAVRVEDIDKAEDGRPFIVMEYIQGRSLDDVIREEAPLSVPRVCIIVKQIAAALEAAHGLGIIHRDIKPSNIVLVESPRGEQAKVLDFGIAKLKEVRVREVAGMTLTSTGMSLGTPAYMSPEQAKGKSGKELDARSDLYSLGVVMYQMLSGELPFKADTTVEMLIAHIQMPPPPIRSRHPEIPEAVAALVMRCLEKKPERRPADAQRLIDEIERSERALAAPSRLTRPVQPSSEPRSYPMRQALPKGAGQDRLRRVSPASATSPPALVIEGAPAGTSVYLDDEPVGTANVDGKLQFQRLAPGRRHLRLSTIGFRDYDEVIEIIPGSTAKVTASLRPLKSAAPLPESTPRTLGPASLQQPPQPVAGRLGRAKPRLALPLAGAVVAALAVVLRGMVLHLNRAGPTAAPQRQIATQAGSSPRETAGAPQTPASPSSKEAGKSEQAVGESPRRPAPEPNRPSKVPPVDSGSSTGRIAGRESAATQQQKQIQTAKAAGDLLYSDGRYSEAVRAYQEGLRLDKSNQELQERADRARRIHAAITEGDLDHDNGQYEEAVKVYQEALNLDPSNQMLLHRIDREKRAEATEQKVIP
jgi:serine/threonine-protein kinase